MPEQWGYTNEASQLEFKKNGLGNEYDLNKYIDQGPEFITIYDPGASLKSKIISVVLILAVIGFCGLLFTFLVREKPVGQTAAQTSVREAQAN